MRKRGAVAALLLLAVGCQSSPPLLTQNIPTAIALSTARPSPTKTIELTPTPFPTATPTAPPTTETETIEMPTPQATEACSSTRGQLIVSDVQSAVLGRRVAYSLYLPPCYDASSSRTYPVLYLLHGANADNTQWPDLNVAPDADALIAQGTIPPLVVVMPDGNYLPGEDYATFVLRDLMPHIEQTQRIAPEPTAHAIGGLSQGGYWAFEIALAHPELFGAVGGHSPATSSNLTAMLTPKNVEGLKKLQIYLDVGQDDSLAPGVNAFSAALEAHGLTPIFHVYPGGHTRPYWRTHTAEYLIFYSGAWQK